MQGPGDLAMGRGALIGGSQRPLALGAAPPRTYVERLTLNVMMLGVGPLGVIRPGWWRLVGRLMLSFKKPFLPREDAARGWLAVTWTANPHRTLI